MNDYINTIKPYITLFFIVIAIVIIWDELAYHMWRRINPGSQYSHLTKPSATTIWTDIEGKARTNS